MLKLQSLRAAPQKEEIMEIKLNEEALWNLKNFSSDFINMGKISWDSPWNKKTTYLIDW